ncbi:uncharacterized protein LOC129598786 [Paramacrobiotus metropolitanus]|uniref:uncharacterized protein LOC129598786 n=1 Tax=Paramacrobiotus metropolitanus TaxID=2943436 RepID=UPI0024461926|nr:uncharacterized protein LOC129598786 [Paramacrobiotus metropolitanus]
MSGGRIAMLGMESDSDTLPDTPAAPVTPSCAENVDCQNIRRIVSAVVDQAVQLPYCHGGIYLENISMCGDQPVTLGDAKKLLSLWLTWIFRGSRNVAYIPPEGVSALPHLTGDTSKADAWAVGCVTIQLLNANQPLQLVRYMRFTSSIVALQMEQPLLPKLQALYSGAGQESDLVIGPQMELLCPIPCACEDFLSRCLKRDPAKRWSLQQLRAHPFLDMSKSADDLFALDSTFYQHTLLFDDMFMVSKLQRHPFLKAENTLSPHQLGELVHKNSSTRPPQLVDVLHFGMYRSKDKELQEQRELAITAVRQLVDALPTDVSADAETRDWANIYKVRALQIGARNLVQHFGCQLVEPGDRIFPMELQVITEHCTGGSFHDAAQYRLPLDIIAKWTRQVLQGLQYLHGHRIAHRNIRSNSIFFSHPDYRGPIKIGGFQYLRNTDTDPSGRCEWVFRPGSNDDGRFASPEIIDMHSADARMGEQCAVWSLGCVVLHLVSGQPPLYTGAKNRPIIIEMAVLYHLNNGPRKLPCIYDWIPSTVQNFIKACLQFDPQQRLTVVDLLQRVGSGVFEEIGADAEYLTHRSGEPLRDDIVEYWKNVS